MNEVKYIKKSAHTELGIKIQNYDDKLLEITAKINEARSFGDLSENAEYQDAMQAYQITFLERNQLYKKYNESIPVDDDQYRLEYGYGENHLCDGDIVRVRVPDCGIPELERPEGLILTVVEDEDSVTFDGTRPLEICTHTDIGKILVDIKFPPRKEFLSNVLMLSEESLPENFDELKPKGIRKDYYNSKNYRDKENIMRVLQILDYNFYGDVDDYYPAITDERMTQLFKDAAEISTEK